MYLKSLFLAAIAASGLLSSCSSEELIQSSSQNEWTENQIRTTLKFTQRFSKETSSSTLERRNSPIVDDPSIGITFRLGRRSRGCEGLGICRVVEKRTDDRHYVRLKATDTAIVHSVLEKDGNGLYALLLLSEKPSLEIPRDRLNLEIEEELILPLRAQDVYVYPGTITFDQSLGQFGGYKIVLHKQSSLQY